jgi:hypothetical protein
MTVLEIYLSMKLAFVVRYLGDDTRDHGTHPYLAELHMQKAIESMKDD